MNNKAFIPSADFGWIDFSPSDRELFTQVLSMLDQPGTVDELGVGVIRDAFSNTMFPGITTIMTRAKYFLIIPYIIKDYALYDCNSSENVSQYLKDCENEIMKNLTLKAKKTEQDPLISEEEVEDLKRGIIGIRITEQNLSRGEWVNELSRKPSSIYWYGLRKYGLINYQDSLNNFLKYLDSLKKEVQSYKDEEDRPVNNPIINFVDAPPSKNNWRKDISIRLSESEAEYLKHKIIDSVSESLLGALLKSDEMTKALLDANDFRRFVEIANLTELNDELKRAVIGADLFWKMMEGAHILFNMLLLDKYDLKARSNKIKEKKWNNWLRNRRTISWEKITPSYIWSLCKNIGQEVDRPTQKFIEGWFNESKKPNPDQETLKKLVEGQEKFKKQNRSKLNGPLEPDLHSYLADGKWVGFSNLDYRYQTTKQIAKDIITTL